MALKNDMKKKQSLHAHFCERQGWLVTPSSLQELLMNIPHRLHNCLQSGLKKNKHKLDTTNFLGIGEKDSCKTWEVDLERQMQAWRENSYWFDHPPELKALKNDMKKKQSLHAHFCERQGWLVTPSSLQELLMNIPHRLHNCLQSGLKKNKHKLDTTNFLGIGEKDSCKTWEVDLERQMQAWRENSYWFDHPPELKVSVPEGSLCNLNVKCNVGLPPDAVFNIVVDPENKRVFKNIKDVISRRVLVDEGPRQVVEVEQAVIWRFLWWSGTMSIQVLVDQNRMDHTIKFKQGKSGFMKRFEGTWKVEPLFLDKELCSPCEPKSWLEYDTCSRGKGRVGSIVSLDQLVQPALVPPPPISWYLRGVTERTTEMLIYDLFAEARRLRGGAAMNSVPRQRLEVDYDKQMGSAVNRSTEIKERWRRQRLAADAEKITGFAVNGSTDIKERWRHRRSKRRHSYKALFADAY